MSFRKAIHSLLQVQDTPERTAFSFALGVFIGFSPLLGLHTLLGLGLAFLFRLNKLAMLMGIYSNNPWILPPFYAFSTWLGVQLLGLPEGVQIPHIGFADLFDRPFWVWLFSQWRLLIPAFAGSFLLCTLLGLLAYPAALWVLRRHRRSWNLDPRQGEAEE